MRKILCLLGLVFVFSLAAAAQADAQDDPRIEGFVGYSVVHTSPGLTSVDAFYANGGVASVALNLVGLGPIEAGVVGEVGGVYVNTVDGRTVEANAETYMLGPKVSVFRHARFTPFVQTLVGFAHSDAGFNGVTRNFNGLAFSPGAGVDWNATSHIGVRLAQVDYLLTRFPSDTNQVTWNNWRYSGGVTLRF